MAQLDLGTLGRTLAESIDNESAWRQLYVVLWPRVLAVCKKRLHDTSFSAEQAAQEVFLRLLHYCPFDRAATSMHILEYAEKVAEDVCIDVTRGTATIASEVKRLSKNAGSSSR